MDSVIRIACGTSLESEREEQKRRRKEELISMLNLSHIF